MKPVEPEEARTSVGNKQDTCFALEIHFRLVSVFLFAFAQRSHLPRRGFHLGE